MFFPEILEIWEIPPLDPGDVCDLSSFGSVHIVQTATFNSDVALLAALHILCHQRKRRWSDISGYNHYDHVLFRDVSPLRYEYIHIMTYYS